MRVPVELAGARIGGRIGGCFLISLKLLHVAISASSGCDPGGRSSEFPCAWCTLIHEKNLRYSGVSRMPRIFLVGGEETLTQDQELRERLKAFLTKVTKLEIDIRCPVEGAPEGAFAYIHFLVKEIPWDVDWYISRPLAEEMASGDEQCQAALKRAVAEAVRCFERQFGF
jgi:hypothetical protein